MLVCCSCPAMLHLKGYSWRVANCQLVTSGTYVAITTCDTYWTTNLINQDHQNCNTKPVLQCPFSASRGQSSHNEIKATGERLLRKYRHFAVICGEKTLMWMAALLQPLSRHNHRLHKHATLTADGKQETQVQFSRYLQDIIYTSALPVNGLINTSLPHVTTFSIFV